MQISRGIIQGAQKVVIYGPEGIGKSYFASKFPNPVFIDTEGSTKHMDVARLPDPSSWTMLLEEVKYVKSNPSICDTLVIDTADWAEQLCIDHLVALAPNAKEHGLGGIEGFGYGKGYTYLGEEFGRLLNNLTDLIKLGINVTLVCHATLRKFEQPDEIGSFDKWELKLQKKTFPLVKEWADMILFANYKTYVVNVDGQGAAKGTNKVQGGKRVMYSTHHPCWDAKNRHDLLDILDFDFNEIKHCIPVRNGSTPPTTKKEPPETVITVTNQEAQKEVQQATITAPPQTKTEFKPANWDDIDKSKQPKVPKALADLMLENAVTVEEIQKAVASKGYYPEDTPIDKYDPGFIDGVLVGAWSQVFGMIQEIRDDIPF